MDTHFEIVAIMTKKKKKKEISFAQKLIRIKRAGIDGVWPPNTQMHSLNDVGELDERIKKVLGIFDNAKINKRHMIYFVMYDIEDNKIRTHIAKYLIKKGCVRVQKSIFLAETDRKIYNEISETLKEVQEVYDNHDSIFLVPVSTDEIKSMKVIGQSIDFDMIMGNKNTLFF